MSNGIKWLKNNLGKVIIAWVLLLVILRVSQIVIGNFIEKSRKRNAVNYGESYSYSNAKLTLKDVDFAGIRHNAADDSDKECIDFGYGFPYVLVAVHCNSDAQDNCDLRLSAEITHESGDYWGDLDRDQPSLWWNDVSEVMLLPGEEDVVRFFNPYCTAQSDQMIIMHVRVQDLTGDTPTEKVYFNLNTDKE